MLKTHKVHQNNNLTTVAIAALVGGLAGAVVGLMCAPKSGKELRQGIYKKADDAIDHVEDVTSHHAEVLKQQGIDLVDIGKQLAEDVQTFVQVLEMPARFFWLCRARNAEPSLVCVVRREWHHGF